MRVNRKFRIQMEVITPLHVGAATDKHYKEGLDYFYDQNRREVVFIGHRQLMSSNNDGSYVDYLLNADYQQIRNLVARNKDFEERRIKLSNHPGDSIKAHIRNGLDGRPIVPGSSIKGALRSVLFNHLRGSNRSNETVFGSLLDHTDFMRYIRVGDAQFDTTSLKTAKIFNLHQSGGDWTGGWKHKKFNGNDGHFKEDGFTTTYEVIPEESTAHFELMLSDVLFDLFHSMNKHRMFNHEQKGKLVHGEIGHLFGVINGYTRRFIEQEIAFFERFEADRSDNIVDNLSEFLLPYIDEPNSCLLRMASGSGFHGITGNWQRNDHVSTVEQPLNGKRYKSRRIAFHKEEGGVVMLPMGYVLLTYYPG